jgi:hypothetical protein
VTHYKGYELYYYTFPLIKGLKLSITYQGKTQSGKLTERRHDKDAEKIIAELEQKGKIKDKSKVTFSGSYEGWGSWDTDTPREMTWEVECQGERIRGTHHPTGG